MKKIIRFFSRITVRLLVFNILIVFLPIAGILLLDTYERQLVKALEDSMAQQGRLVSAALSGTGTTETSLSESATRIVANLMSRTESRLRIVDSRRMLLADSSVMGLSKESGDAESSDTVRSDARDWRVAPDVRENFLYRIASAFMQVVKKVFLPPAPDYDQQVYAKGAPIRGAEVTAALSGKYGATTRISGGGQRSVTLYIAIPIWSGQDVSGAVLVSQSTYKILKDLYELRLAIFKVFIASFCAAVLISLFLSFTIGRPLRKLTLEAGAIVDHRGRMMRPFAPLKQHDEVGDLSRSLVRLTEQLENHIGFIESFAGDISHEFKNPLASIRTSAELALRASNLEDKTLFTEKILADCGRLEKLITGVREISRIDAGLAGEEAEPVNVTELLRNLVSGYEQRLNDNAILLDTPDRAICVHASHYRLTEVFENLADNALSFSPKDRPVGILVNAKAGRVSVTVTDEGPGIPEEHMTKIFGRFFLLQADRKRKQGAHRTRARDREVHSRGVRRLDHSIERGQGRRGIRRHASVVRRGFRTSIANKRQSTQRED
jgi:two-component system sensor histidine kinase ChvG